MLCDRCGACCEEFFLPAAHVFATDSDHGRWLRLHANIARETWGEEMRFECKCTALTAEGKCGIYNERPEMCREFEPGSNDCVETVRRRRTPEQYARIRGEGDPQ